MRRIYFLSLLVCFFTIGNLYSQTGCCPYITSITIIPATPTTNDTIRIVTLTATPNLGNEVSYSLTQSADTFNLFGCFYSGMLTQPQTYLDTTSIGILAAGTYHVYYIAKMSASPTLCSVIDSNSMSATFEVTQASGFENLNSENSSFLIYPNPSNDIFTLQTNLSGKADIFITNLLGERILQQKIIADKTEINLADKPNGIYFVQAKSEKGTFAKKLLLQR